MNGQITRMMWDRLRHLVIELVSIGVTPDQIYKSLNARLDFERQKRKKK
ncbi:hypothetical protein ES703_45035 [subsurface metagenome]